MKKHKSYYSDEVVKAFMEMCKEHQKKLELVLKDEETCLYKIDSPERMRAVDELVALADLMSYIDTKHKDYLLDQVGKQKKETIGKCLELFKKKKYL